jgi:hypothetical protein
MQTLAEAVVGRERASVIDLETMLPTKPSRYAKLFEFYAARGVAVKQAEAHVATLPGVESGRYVIDVSHNCGDCHSFHSEEADCAS